MHINYIKVDFYVRITHMINPKSNKNEINWRLNFGNKHGRSAWPSDIEKKLPVGHITDHVTQKHFSYCLILPRILYYGLYDTK